MMMILITALCLTITSTLAIGGPVGGQTTVPVSDHIKDLVRQHAVPDFNSNNYLGESNEMILPTKYLDADIPSATSQVVAGAKYRVEVVYGETACQNQLGNSIDSFVYTDFAEQCPLAANGQQVKCTVTIWEKPWENFVQVISQDCQN